MNFEFSHPETGAIYKLETDKKFIIIYGKNGSGKTTLSRNSNFTKELVFNEDFVNSNIYTISETGATLSSENKKNFSKLWIGQDIVEQSKAIEQLNQVISENSSLKDKVIENLKLELNSTLAESAIDQNQFIQDNFEYVDQNLNENSVNYKCNSYRVTSIQSEESLKQEVSAIKNNAILNLFHSLISKNSYLKEMFINSNNLPIVNEFNILVNNLKEFESNLKKIDFLLTEKNITKELSNEIHQWLNLHESRSSCLFCGNNDIDKAKIEWREIFKSEAKVLKNKLLDFVQSLLQDLGKILASKEQFKLVIANTISELENVNKILLIKKGEIECNEFHEIELKTISFSIELVSIDQKKLHVQNYVLNKHLDQLIFFISNDNALKKKRDTEKTKLSELMDKNGKKYSDGINGVLEKLGLEKAIEFKTNKHTNPFTFEFKLIDNREIKTLSDGQKHKLALAMFLYSLKEKNYNDKTIVIDDPVVSLDVLSYHQVKSFLIHELVSTFEQNGDVSLILMTHNINFLYIQLSNDFESEDMRKKTEVFRLGTKSMSKVDLDIFRTDDITLFKTALTDLRGEQDVYLLSNLILKVFRIMIDLRLRFRGIMTDKVGVSLLELDISKQKELNDYHTYFCKYFKNDKTRENDILMEGFRYLKEAAQVIGFGELISEDDMSRIEFIINNHIKDTNIDSPCFDILLQLDNFFRSANNDSLRNYIEHPKNTFTKNMVTLSLNNDI